jgi:hypothetical protein
VGFKSESLHTPNYAICVGVLREELKYRRDSKWSSEVYGALKKEDKKNSECITSVIL